MKVTNLALLLTLVILRTDAFRLPQLDKTEKDPLHLSKLFQAMTSFFKGIDTKEESNLKYHVNVTKRTPLLGPNPNAFFPYAHYASIPKSNGNQTNINWNTYYTFKELEEFAVRYFTVWRSISYPHLDKTHKDPLHFSTFICSISTFVNDIDGEPDANLKNVINTTNNYFSTFEV